MLQATLNAKVVLLGASYTGKTSILSRLINGSFNDSQMATIGAAFSKHTFSVDGKVVKMEIWDTAGQERFNSLSSMYYRGAEGALVVFDVTSEESFEAGKRWCHQVRVDMPDIVLILVGNKVDLKLERLVSTDVAEAFVASEVAREANPGQPHLYYLECSAKIDVNVQEVFQLLARALLDAHPGGTAGHRSQPSLQLDERPSHSPGCC